MEWHEHHIEAVKSIAPREVVVIAGLDVEQLSHLQAALTTVIREVKAQADVIQELKALNETHRLKIDVLEGRPHEKHQSDETDKEPDESSALASLEQRIAALEGKVGDSPPPLPTATSPEGEWNENGLAERLQALEDAFNLAREERTHVSPVAASGDGVTKEDLDALARRLNDKADRSELDAILSPPPPGADDNEASPIGSVDLDQLRNLIRVLGERVNNKADQRALDDSNSQIDGLKGRFTPLQAQIDALESKLASLRKTMNEMGATVDAMEPELKLVSREMRSSVSEVKAEIEGLKRHLSEKGEPLSSALLPSEGEPALAPLAGSGPDSDLGHLVRDMQISLKSKVDGKDLARVVDRVDDLTAALEALKKTPHGLPLGLEGKADLSSLQAEVDALKDALAAKADALRLASLALEARAALAEGLAPKADRADLDDLRLRVSLMTPGSSGEDGSQGSGPSEGILEAIKGMLGDKADKVEVYALREAVADKTVHLKELCDDLAARLAALRDALQAIPPPTSSAGYSVSPEALDAKTNKADFDELAGQVRVLSCHLFLIPEPSVTTCRHLSHAGQVGDLFAELQRIRSQRERDVAAAANGIALAPPQAHALASKPPTAEVVVGKEAASKSDVDALSDDVQKLEDQIDMISHAVNTIAVGLEPRVAGNLPPLDSAQAGKEPRETRGAFDRLVKHVGSRSVKKKMDYFDPGVLNDLSVKAAAFDTFLRSPGYNRTGAPDLGMKDLEAQVKRLSITVKGLKSSSPLQASSGRLADPGDHAMLSGKPLMGYRCLACDRPLEGLDTERGPHLPTQVIPRSTIPVIGGGGGGSPPLSPIDRSGNPPLRPGTVDPSLVGPKLPPGGWRASQSGTPGSGMTYTARTSVTGEAGLPRI